MDIKMIPAVGALKVEQKKERTPVKKKFFHIRGKIVNVQQEGNGTLITIKTEESKAQVGEISGEYAILTNG